MTQMTGGNGRPSVAQALAWLESRREPTKAQLTSMRVMRNMAGLPFLTEEEDLARAAALPEMHDYMALPGGGVRDASDAVESDEEEHDRQIAEDDGISEMAM